MPLLTDKLYSDSMAFRAAACSSNDTRADLFREPGVAVSNKYMQKYVTLSILHALFIQESVNASMYRVPDVDASF
ncbi:MAG: hypothetical protein ACD_39C00620G0005 [uncultured bacterium]|nr:MAG: hypothetical protein ACD_39C00620G0005 [uncultured bacterium]